MITDDPTEALAAVAAGESVVLVVGPEAAPVARPGTGPGRLAILVGGPREADVRSAAEAMEAELFARGAAEATPGRGDS